MEAKEIARRAQLPVRVVRYIIEHRLLQYVISRPVPGRAGVFIEFHAFWIAVVGTLYHYAGLRRSALEAAIALLSSAPWPLRPLSRDQRPPVSATAGWPWQAIQWLYADAPRDARFEIGDLVLLRVKARGFDSHWVQFRSWRRLDRTDRPHAIIRQDLGELRRAFGGIQ